jgi:hypothetical protein
LLALLPPVHASPCEVHDRCGAVAPIVSRLRRREDQGDRRRRCPARPARSPALATEQLDLLKPPAGRR